MNTSLNTQIQNQKYIVLKAAIISRVFLWVYSIAISGLIDNFDSSTGLKSISPLKSYEEDQKLYLRDHTTESQFVNSFIKRVFVKWDSIYFTRIAEFGYEYEQNHAFFPLYPLLMNGLGRVISILLGNKVIFSDCIIIAGFIISNVAFILSALQLLKLGNIIFKNSKISLVAALLYCMNPAGIFTVAVYTESLFSLFIFSGLVELFGNDYYLGVNGRSLDFHYLPLHKKLLAGTKSSIYFALATFTRSNGILSCGFIIFSYYSHYFISLFRMIFKRLNSILTTSKTRLVKPHLSPSTSYDKLSTSIVNPVSNYTLFEELVILPTALLIQILIVFAPYIAFQFYGYLRFCSGASSDLNPIKNGIWPRVWCQEGIVPNLYGFVQNAYWNQGFFNYYTVNQIPNFLLASPMVIIAVSGIFSYIRYFIQNPNQMIYSSFKLRSKNMNISEQVESFYSPHLIPFILYLLFLTVFSVAFMHVQVITRFFIHSPIIFWFSAKHFLTNGTKDNTPKKSTNTIIQQIILFYFILYNVLGCIMFCNFYPWT
ncbi:phosphatidylinositol glycan [Tieghemostelium lacteum]|uniref:GPI mannosyltransferase 2 n=1 Tax=Tieghemostelium lacteum TaxID=361077 RepID=A0A151Z844_TIELA|nr:phosphatidylinositol glycan [Tieghemostelium lacteum]|eukprot:KYQ90121.1 phosphatidylinositol glycan [Tieghemostelium lacteum]